MRKIYIDNIRIITVLLVVFYHVIYMFNGIVPYGVLGAFQEVQYQDALQYVLYPWFMVILFLVSGVSARCYLATHSGRDFISSRTRKLLVPSTLGVLVFGWMQGYFSMTFSGAFDTMPETIPVPVLYLILSVSGIGVLWYIQMLWIFSMLLLAVRKIEKNRLEKICRKTSFPVLLMLGIFVWLSAQVLNTPVIAVYRFGIYGFCFFLGYFVFAHEEVIERLQRWSLPLLTAAAALAVVYVKVYFGRDYATAPVVNSPLSILYCWVVCLAVFGSARRWGNRSCRFLDYLRQKSFGIYVFHYLVISMAGYVLVNYTAFPAWAVYVLCLISACPGAILLYEVISRIPVLRFCVLGIRKKDHEKKAVKTALGGENAQNGE